MADNPKGFLLFAATSLVFGLVVFLSLGWPVWLMLLIWLLWP